MTRAFDDLGQSPFEHRRRQKAALLAAQRIVAPKQETNDHEKSSHDTAEAPEELTVTPPPKPTMQAEGPPSQAGHLDENLPPITDLAAIWPTKRDLPLRKLLSWSGTDLGISPFKGRRRVHTLVDATVSDTSRSELAWPTAASLSSGPLNTQASIQDHQPSGVDTKTVSAPRSSLRSELKGLTLTGSLDTKPAALDSVARSTASVSHTLVRNKARSLTAKKSLTPQPFLNTHLGRVPPEVREMIWEYILISPSSRVRVEYPENDAQSQPESQSSSKATPGQRQPESPKLPGMNHLSVLRTCRLIREEGQHIFFSMNSFQLTSASDLVAFITGIGVDCCKKLKSLHLGGLLGQKLRYSERDLDIYCQEGKFGFGRRDNLAQELKLELHPDARKAARVLKGCLHLKSIDIEMKVGEEFYITLFLQGWHGYDGTAIDFSDDFSWIVRPIKFKGEAILGIPKFWELAKPSGPNWGDQILGNDRLVNVTIVSPELKVGSEFFDDVE